VGIEQALGHRVTHATGADPAYTLLLCAHVISLRSAKNIVKVDKKTRKKDNL
jgi:hypothetical protein